MLIEALAQREELFMQIPVVIAELYRLRAPVRRAVTGPAIRREMPKIGRNDKVSMRQRQEIQEVFGVTAVQE